MNHTTRTQKGIKANGLYKNLYQQIDMQGPGMDDMAAQSGGSMADQARAANYQDMYRNIQAMRDAEYKKEVARGEMTNEFSGLGGSHTTRTQQGVRDKGLYNHLLPRTAPVHHPYLPRTVTSPSRRSGLGSYLGEAAQKTAPGLILAIGAFIVYTLFFKKKEETTEEPETAEEAFVEEEIEPVSSRFYY